MPKNIVICSDGTGNTAIKGRGTNVFKLYEAVDLNAHRLDPSLTRQIAFYDDGVGTENLRYLRWASGATGWGLSRNVKQLYTELVRVYDPGDKIFLFGFSRGAFTVRTLAGLIATCGVLDLRNADFTTAAGLRRGVERAYKNYRRKYRTKLSRGIDRLFNRSPEPAIAAFCKKYAVWHPEHAPGGKVAIEFIGVWDTVDAVGLPFHLSDVINATIYRFKFPDHTLSPLVKRACHALAIDDERHSFRPVLWDERRRRESRIEQVWFAGAHSNVGGGYPKHGMSLVSLEWMMSRAELCGLRFSATDRQFVRDRYNVDDKLYDPRSGLGVFYRWKPRDLRRLCLSHGVAPAVHISVFERVSHGTEGYAPVNLPPHCKIVETTPSGVPLAAVRGLIRQKHGSARALLWRVRRALRVGFASYYVLLVSLSLALLQAIRLEWFRFSQSQQDELPRRLLDFGVGMASREGVWDVVWRLATDVVASSVLATGLITAYILATITDRSISKTCSEFWHDVQPDLRRVLTPLAESEAPPGELERLEQASQGVSALGPAEPAREVTAGTR